MVETANHTRESVPTTPASASARRRSPSRAGTGCPRSCSPCGRRRSRRTQVRARVDQPFAHLLDDQHLLLRPGRPARRSCTDAPRRPRATRRSSRQPSGRPACAVAAGPVDQERGRVPPGGDRPTPVRAAGSRSACDQGEYGGDLRAVSAARLRRHGRRGHQSAGLVRRSARWRDDLPWPATCRRGMRKTTGFVSDRPAPGASAGAACTRQHARAPSAG